MAASQTLAPTVAGYSTDIDQERRLPEPLAQQLKGAGVFRMLLAKGFGGLGVDPITATEVVETIS